MTKHLLFGAILCASVLVSSLRAETLTHSGAGLQFDVPEGWKTEQAEDLLLASNADGDLVVMIFVAKAENAEEFLKGMDEELGKIVKDAKITSGPTESKLNGLDIEFVEGTGKCVSEKKAKGEEEAAEVDWFMSVIQGGKKVMVSIAFGKLKENHDDVVSLYKSIKKAE